MKGKHRTPLPRSPTRKRKPGPKPVKRPKGEAERLARRRRDAMKYRLAGASYRVIAEKLTDDRASEYADANGISVERAMKKIQHVSTRTVWDDVTAEYEELRLETEGESRGLDGAPERPVGSGVLEGAVAVREWQRAGWPTGYRDDGTALPFRCRIVAGTRPAASRCRGTRRTLRTGVWGAMERKVRLATAVSGVSERSELAPSDRFRYGERVASQQVDVLVAER